MCDPLPRWHHCSSHRFPTEPAKTNSHRGRHATFGDFRVCATMRGVAGVLLRSVSGSIGAHPMMQRLIGLPFSPPLQSPAQGAILWARDRITAS